MEELYPIRKNLVHGGHKKFYLLLILIFLSPLLIWPLVTEIIQLNGWILCTPTVTWFLLYILRFISKNKKGNMEYFKLSFWMLFTIVTVDVYVLGLLPPFLHPTIFFLAPVVYLFDRVILKAIF